MDNVRMRLIIEGRVQGVWFRDSTRRKAHELGVFGWVRNRPDGNVELICEGETDRVDRLIEWCHEGPIYAKVTRVEEIPEEWKGEFDSFDIVF